MKKLLALTAALALAASGFGQLVITTTNSPITIDFDTTLTGVSNNQFAGTGFTPTPAAGQLNSNAWAVTGWSNGDLAFGGTQATATTDYTRGTTTLAVGTGGMYAFGTVDRQLMIQPGGTDWAPGTLTLKTQNGMGAGATAFSISYDLFVRNDQARSNSFNLTYSLDGGTTFVNTGLVSQSALFQYTSVAAVDALGWIKVGTATASITLTSDLIPGGDLLFRWSGADVGGSGSRDEFGLDNISVSMTAIPEPSTYAAIMGLLTLGVVLYRRRKKA